MTPTITAGRVAIIVGNLAYSIGAFIADYSETHVFNERWPPHVRSSHAACLAKPNIDKARFHNGQTMSLGVLLATTSLFYLFKPARDHKEAKDNLLTSALVGSFYCFAAMTAILYPGTAWQDPEFHQGGEQRFVFSGICVLMLVGYLLESRRLAKTKSS